jgi:hypothetical protein
MRSILIRPLSRPATVLAAATTGLYVAAWLILQPPYDTFGDAPGYIEAMRVWNGMPPPDHFTPNRLLTTFLSVGSVATLAAVTGNYFASWFFLNTLYFFGLAFTSYALFARVSGSKAAAVLGALFVVGNYDVLVFGLNYLMDGAGWFWFMLSMLALFLYMEEGKRRFLLGAVLAAGVGGLFKEYAFLAFAPIGIGILYTHRRDLKGLLESAGIAALGLVPLALVHVGFYVAYGYSYLDWYSMGVETFGFDAWIWNASRSYLVVLSFLLPFALLGTATFVREMRSRFDPMRTTFVLSCILPSLAVLAWPIITERLVFLIVPLAALMATYAFKRYPRGMGWYSFIWLLYVMLALKTDGLILNALYSW